MAKGRKKICVTCGEAHWGAKDACCQCSRSADEEVNAKYCLICGSRIKRGNGLGFGHYCSRDCVSALNSARARAAYLVGKNINSGVLARAKECFCVDCGRPASHYDHREYLKPLDVVPVCVSCNISRGPAIDVKQTVAEYLNVSVDDLNKALEKLKKKNQARFKKEMREINAKMVSIKAEQKAA